MKAYVKPELTYESFTLSHSIAACSASKESEIPEYLQGVVFSGDSCEMDYATAVENGMIEIYCYQSSDGGSDIFAS